MSGDHQAFQLTMWHALIHGHLLTRSTYVFYRFAVGIVDVVKFQSSQRMLAYDQFHGTGFLARDRPNRVVGIT